MVCPHLGEYSVTGQSRAAREPDERHADSHERHASDRDARALAPEFSALRVGCQSHDTIVLAGRVSDQSRGEFSTSPISIRSGNSREDEFSNLYPTTPVRQLPGVTSAVRRR